MSQQGAVAPAETVFIPVDHAVDPSRVPDEPLKPPFPEGGLVDVFRRRYLLRLLVEKEIQSRYLGSLLGLLWSYVLPGVRFAMYFFVMGVLLKLHKSVPNFAIHLFCGLVFVTYFTQTFQSGTRSIMRNKALVKKMAMPREMFPVAAVIVSAIQAFPQLVILLVASVAAGYHPSAASLGAFVLGLTILTLFGTGLALMFSALNVFFRDFQNFVAMLMLFTHWAVPMIYPWSRVANSGLPDWGKEVYLANPLAEAVVLMQRAFWLPTCDTDGPECVGPSVMPDHLFSRGFVMVGVGLVFLAAAQLVFSRLESSFAERLN